MKEEWVWWWFRYMQASDEYYHYYEGMENTTEEDRPVFMAQFLPTMEQLRIDWGDLDFWPDSMEDERWKQWFASKRHLFYPRDVVECVASTAEHVAADGRMLLDIDPSADETIVIRKVRSILREATTKPNGSDSMPRYKLFVSPGGKVDSKTLGEVAKAYLFGNHFKRRGLAVVKDDRELELFLLNHGETVGWRLGGVEKEQLKEPGKFSREKLKTYRDRVNRYLDRYKAYSVAAGFGVFPCKDEKELEQALQAMNGRNT
jgi:hypothetical protein